MIPAVLLLSLTSVVAGTVTTTGTASAAATPHSRSYYDWVTYHGNRARSGYTSRAKTLGASKLKVAKTVKLDGAVYDSPIVADGFTIVATENNTVYALNQHNQFVWKRHLAPPSPAAQRPCGNIDPLGITGTPLYQPSTGLIYVAAELSGTPPTHRLYGIRLGTGNVAFQRTLDLPGVDSAAMQERGSLTESNGRVWVPFGGLAGDCGAYKGRVVGYSLHGTGSPVSYTVPTGREAGIWTPPGPSVDSAGNLYVAVGNGASGQGDPYDHSDSVLKLNGSAKLADSFSPSTWAVDNEGDLDLGSQGPALVGTKWVFADGKRGTAYVLRRTHLGGIGGQVSQVDDLCKSFGGTAQHDNVVYVPCTDGLRAVRISSTGTMSVAWHAGSSITGAPVIGGGVVWSLDTGAGTLYALGHGGVVKASVAVGSVTRFATPALSNNRVLVGTTTGLTVVTY